MHIIHMGFPHKLTHTDCLEIVYLHLDFYVCTKTVCFRVLGFWCFRGDTRLNPHPNTKTLKYQNTKTPLNGSIRREKE